MSGMSRYIWCPSCVNRFHAAHGIYEDDDAEPHPDEEHTTIWFGFTAQEQLLCDLCNRPLPQGTFAAGVTMCDRPEDYRQWEHEFFATLAGPEPQKDERPSGFPDQRGADDRSSEPTPSQVAGHVNAWPIISMNTRCQAIADGVLLDVTPVAREAGFRYPVAVTCGVWSQCVAVPPGVSYQDESGRLWDVLTMLAYAARASRPTPVSELRYELIVRDDESDEEPPPVELVGNRSRLGSSGFGRRIFSGGRISAIP